MTKEAKVWFEQSESDFEDARLLWKNHRYGAAILFYQQSVEKILKAYFVEEKKEAPRKTHRIEILITDSGLDLSEIELAKSTGVEELSKAYIRVRYPDLSRQYYQKRERAEPLVKLGEEIFLWVRKKFKKH